MIRPILIDKNSPLLGEECALCKELLAPGDEAIICPEDGARHHVFCWRSNGNKCTAYGCMGNGRIADYIMIEILGWQYRTPLGGALLAAVNML